MLACRLPVQYYFLVLLLLLIKFQGYSQRYVGFIPGNDHPEAQAAWNFLKGQNIACSRLEKDDLSSAINLTNNFKLLWFHLNDTNLVSIFSDNQTAAVLRDYVVDGGDILLTQDAFPLVHQLGFESSKPQKVLKESKDNGYGRQLGMHSFLGHPVFDGLNGGAYIYKPVKDTSVRLYGYFENQKPFDSYVIAVDWDYIFLRENKKIMLEREYGSGKVIAIGGYVNFLPGNANRPHLEKFVHNIFKYFSRDSDKHPWKYWTFYDPRFVEFEYSGEASVRSESIRWNMGTDLPAINAEKANSDYWDVATQRMLVMGKEKGGIEEVWSHPFMACRDLETGIQFNERDSIHWLNEYLPDITVLPNAFIRKYLVKGHEIQEVITASIDDPVTLIHYELAQEEDATLHFRFSSNMRIMWPYSQKVSGDLYYTFDEGLNAFIVNIEAGYTTLVGSMNETDEQVIGNYEPFRQSANTTGKATDKYLVSGGFSVKTNENNAADIIIAASTEDMKDAVSFYREVSDNPWYVFAKSGEYYQNFIDSSLLFISPDPLLNEGFEWAKLATDQFFVHTPGLGKSFTAGYATTRKGWDGNHEVNGRPGYGWYFGRDAQWSGMATLHYGDFNKIRSTLEMFIKFQDLNGKIFHELSTSGFVHYDAADATPLFIVLAGRYLKHSGDIEFIENNWNAFEKAIEYCYSTDTDQDLLIENTNVGHGWVEGGFLFGSKTSLYLASCWAEALMNAHYMAKHLGLRDESERFLGESEKVTAIIREKFWNSETGFFNQGIYSDGTFLEEPSILSFIPVLFGQAGNQQAASIVSQTAGFNYTSDWGCRITGKNSERYNPRGYHTGSVWPLYTGWASLGEYRSGNSIQGFTHLMNNISMYKYWGPGYIEEVVHGEIYQPSGVCHHQCWSETMAIQPLIEGLLGYRPDALEKRMVLSPNLPAGWDSLQVKKIRCGDDYLSLEMHRSDGKVTYKFDKSGDGDIMIEFNPFFPPGTEVKDLFISGEKNAEYTFKEFAGYTQLKTTFTLQESREVKIITRKGISLLPLVPEPVPGDTTVRPKIISHMYEEGIYSAVLEGITGTVDTLKLWHNGYRKLKAENCKIVNSNKHIAGIRVEFNSDKNTEVKKEIFIKVK